jgi:anti-anti-sigma factor
MFALHVIRGEAVAQIVVMGELRGPQADVLSDCITALAERGVLRVIVDLGRTEFVNPAACRTLLRAAGRVDRFGAALLLTGVRARTRALLVQRHGYRPHCSQGRRCRTASLTLLGGRR